MQIPVFPDFHSAELAAALFLVEKFQSFFNMLALYIPDEALQVVQQVRVIQFRGPAGKPAQITAFIPIAPVFEDSGRPQFGLTAQQIKQLNKQGYAGQVTLIRKYRSLQLCSE